MNFKYLRSLLILVPALLICMSTLAVPVYEGSAASKLHLTYEVGKNNDAAGVAKNTTNQPVRIVLEFKGYASDGVVSQSGGMVIIDHLGPGESARFRAVGFTERIVRVELISVRTTLP